MNDYTQMLQDTLTEYCRMRGITDMSRESMNRWNAYLNYAHKQIFGNRREFLAEPYSIGNLKNGAATNHNSYDYNKLHSVCDAYVYVCYDWNKEISICGYCRLTGLSRETLFAWGRGDRLNPSSMDIYKKIKCEREESLSNKLWDSKNPIAALAMLNAKCGWRQPLPEPTRTDTPQPLAAIAEKYGIKQEREPPGLREGV